MPWSPKRFFPSGFPTITLYKPLFSFHTRYIPHTSNSSRFYLSNTIEWDQPRGLVVRVSDYWSTGPGSDSRFCHGEFSLKGNLDLRPLLVLHIHILPSTPSGQRNCASWASQTQKSVTLR
jgi:hypothetical protein